MVWPLVVAAGASIVAGAIQSNDAAQRAKGEANKIKDAQKKAAESGIAIEEKQLAEQQYQFDQQMAEYQRKQALLEQQFNQTQQLLQPYIQSGTGALYEMNALMGLAAPQPVTYNMQKSPTTGQYEVVQQPTAQRPSPALRTGGPAPTTPTGGNLGILSQSVAPIRTDITAGRGVLSDEAQAVLSEFDKGGLSLTSNQWASAQPGASPRKQAADILQETIAQMPNATTAQQIEVAKQKASALGSQQQFGSSGPMGMVRDLGKFIGNKVIEPSYQTAKEEAAARATQQPSMAQTVSPYAGMTGEQAQQTAIQRISESPLLAELTRQGEEALLQRSAATGGLRGGNIQGALAQYRPAMLQNEIDKYYSRLAQMSGVGQQSILSSPTMGQAGGYPTQYPVSSNLGNLYGNLALSQGIQPSAASQGGATQAITSGIGQIGSAVLGYYANKPQTNTVWSGTA